MKYVIVKFAEGRTGAYCADSSGGDYGVIDDSEFGFRPTPPNALLASVYDRAKSVEVDALKAEIVGRETARELAAGALPGHVADVRFYEFDAGDWRRDY